MKPVISFFWWTVLYICPCIAVGALLLGIGGVFLALILCPLLVIFIEPESLKDESSFFWKRIIEDVEKKQSNQELIHDPEKLKRWKDSDAPYKAQCAVGLCISYYHPINCQECLAKRNFEED